MLLVVAVAIAVLLPVIGSFMYRMSNISTNTHLVKVLAIRGSLETRIREWVAQPASYISCDGINNQINCAINTLVFDRFTKKTISVPGAACIGTQICGFTLTNLSLSTLPASPNLFFNGTLQYNGTEVKGVDIILAIPIPNEILQPKKYTCPAATPIFSGFGPYGNVICNPIPMATCPPGAFVAAVDPITLNLKCSPLPTSAGNCGPTEFISSINYIGNPGFGAPNMPVVCTGRLNPFTLGW